MGKSEVLTTREEILAEIKAIGELNSAYKTSGEYRPEITSNRGALNIKTASSGALQDAYISTLGGR